MVDGVRIFVEDGIAQSFEAARSWSTPSKGTRSRTASPAKRSWATAFAGPPPGSESPEFR